MDAKELGFVVAEVRVVEELVFKDREPIKKGTIVTISSLNHPTDVKLWNGGTWQVDPSYFDIKNPVRIIRGLKNKTFFCVKKKQTNEEIL